MDISKIDYWATSGKSVMHGASALSKSLATAAVVATVIIARDLLLFLCMYLFLIAAVRLSRLPVFKVMAISAFPGLFALLFALSLSGEGYYLPLLVVAKALTAATAMVLLITTTPYLEVISIFGRFLPGVVRDGLFMTYRSFFILFEMFDRFLVALRLRGGFQPSRLAGNAGNVASGVGMLFIRAYDRSQRLYDVMTIRGYGGMLSAGRPAGGFGVKGVPYFVTAALFLGMAISFRLAPGARPGVWLFAVPLAFYIGMEALEIWKK